ncbi:Clavaminate synthase-like protein [Ophiobolus disseminans]|uniref:Clavaminate synthase-like protein n=1 Tax=Ophiobolus disseminans TaxID=1469910 RepID=A0A6A7A4K2_9PLEO|nr:Clavaminate synthase-like protein [Ophiobolus disseminans]
MVPELSYTRKPHHVAQVAEHLRELGILKVSLQFPDPNSQYLEQLIIALHQNHGQRLPISHSALRGAFWDVRPSTTNFQAGDCQARSETTDEFPWHTDCSYEDQPPRFFALHVLQHDRYGGGTLSVMNVKRLSEHLSPTTRTSLTLPEYRIKVPPEFIKVPDQRSICASIFVTNDECEEVFIRYRKDLLGALSQRASRALEELETVLREGSVQSSLSLQLSAEDLPKGSVILIDNRRWLHARNRIYDEERHLRRVRWDAAPFGRNCQ